MSSPQIIGAVEIGTSKVVVLVGESSARGKLRIIGKGECTSRGVTKGEIIDFKAASDCVHAAIMQAEQEAGVTIREIYLSQTGRHLESFYNEGTVTVMSSDNIVRRDDVLRVVQDAKSKELANSRLYIHHIRNPFRLDERVVQDPVGMEGEKLQAGYWCITGERAKISDHVGIINGIGMHVEDMIISSLASGVMVASQEDKRNGVLVIDIGSGTTDYVVYKNGYVAYCGVVAVGGDHITNDLTVGLRMNRANAEKLKKEQGKAYVDKADAEKRIWKVGDKGIGDRSILVTSLQRIIQARVEELFTIVAKKISEQIPLSELSAGAVLTGGTSQLFGIEQVAADVLGIEARKGQHPEWIGSQIDGAQYSTVLGLFYYALTANDRDDTQHASKGRSILKKLISFKL